MDEGGRTLKTRLGYEKVMRAIGRYCDQQQLDEVCIMEFEKGVVLQGIKVESTGEGYIRRMITNTLSYEQLNEMAKRGSH